MRLIYYIDRGLHALYRWCGYLAAAFIVLIALLVLVNIVSRMAGEFVPGMTEGAGYCMAAAGALGLTYTFAEHGHIRVTILINRTRGRPRFVLEFLALTVAAGLICFLAAYTVQMVWTSYLFEERSDGSDDLPIWIPQVPMVLGFVVFAVSLVHAVVTGLVTGEIASDSDDRPFAPDSPES